jgi:hypothetical protein
VNRGEYPDWRTKKHGGSGYILKRFIYGQRFNQWREEIEYFKYLFGHFLLSGHSDRQNDPVGAKLHGGCHRLGGVDTEFAGFV